MQLDNIDTTILVAIVSATSVVIGVLISQISILLKEHFNKKYLRKVLLREKYEEFTEYIQKAIVYSNKSEDCKSITELSSFAINEPLRNSYYLSIIYFPEFKDCISTFNNSYIEHYKVLVESYKREINEAVGTQAAAHNYEKYVETSRKFLFARQNVDDLIEKLANKYIKA